MNSYFEKFVNFIKNFRDFFSRKESFDDSLSMKKDDKVSKGIGRRLKKKRKNKEKEKIRKQHKKEMKERKKVLNRKKSERTAKNLPVDKIDKESAGIDKKIKNLDAKKKKKNKYSHSCPSYKRRLEKRARFSESEKLICKFFNSSSNSLDFLSFPSLDFEELILCPYLLIGDDKLYLDDLLFFSKKVSFKYKLKLITSKFPCIKFVSRRSLFIHCFPSSGSDNVNENKKEDSIPIKKKEKDMLSTVVDFSDDFSEEEVSDDYSYD